MLYAIMLMMGVGGLMVTAQVSSVGETLGISKAMVTLALTINLIANGSGRIFWGWVSDQIGRERTMITAFMLQSLALLSLLKVGRGSPVGFIVCLAVVLFTYGEIYSIFPAASADFFGGRNASSNYSFLYSSKGVASIMAGWLAALLFERTGTWTVVFYGSAMLAFLAGLMAWGLMAIPLPSKQRQLAATPAPAVKGIES
jgi:OFA family oxalate/formate antiporter-like MFS transporter